MPRYFLGLDSSTQSMTALIIDLDTQSIVCEQSVAFDDFPHYGTSNGVLPNAADPRVVHAPPLVWLEALDTLLRKLEQNGAPLSDILAVSGSGQQHGTVYLNDQFEAALANLNPDGSLAQNLAATLARSSAPIWMDSSTSQECAEIRAALGGPRATAEATGSDAFERFSGPQIRRFAQTAAGEYARTQHIALVSSYLASVMTGRVVPIDQGDGAGMNLMDIAARTWHPQALEATAEGLADRLPPLAPSWTVAGPVSPYFSARFGLNPACQSVVWSGDNPNSVVGLGLVDSGMTAISLGTSDTYFGTMSECRSDPRGEGHVFVSPTGDYMTLICFKNGSLAREKIKDQYGMNWEQFSAALRDTPPGNNGGLMLPYFEPEIVPRVLEPGIQRHRLDPQDAAANCRAVVEAQMLSMRIHSAWMGERPSRIYATGGASANSEILQIMADVHRCPVHRMETTASAALGAALRAAQAWLAQQPGATPEWKEVVAGFTDPVEGSCIQPRAPYAAIYDEQEKAYAAFEGGVGRGE